MKRYLISILLCLLLAMPAQALCFTDARGRSVEIESPQRVVALYDSYGDAWLAAGGELIGSAQDGMLESAGRSVGSHSQPNLELLLELNPDFVLLSADVSAQADTGAWLDAADIPCAYFSTKDYREYMQMLRLFTQLTGRDDLYAAQIERVQQPIEAIIQSVSNRGRRTALLLRAFSSGIRAKNSEDTVAGIILKDMGFVNIADGESPLSESLSLEAILLADPDYIFIVAMGESSQDAMETLERQLTGNPAWAGLRAVQNGRCVVLDPDLFHRHPNERWAEAYQTILNLILAEETP